MDMARKSKAKPPLGAPPPRAYPDLHDHLRALDAAGLLITVDRAIDKDTEMHPLVRWQFRGGIEEKDRKAFLFRNVTDAKGRKYDIPVAVGVLAASREIYRIGMGCALDAINDTWNRAVARPIAPRVVANAPCQEIVISGAALEKPGNGLDGLPVPISTPGWDIAPYTTLSQYITKDPDTGVQNMGIYRGQVKAPRRLGMNPSLELRPGIYTHWEKCRAAGKKLEAAVVLGAPPAIAYTSAQKLPESMDELTVAGGLVGAPINVVRAKTVDLLVPAEAEIVIEGLIETEWLEPEAPFGESHGHVNLQEYNAYMEVTCITRRRDAVLTSIISQVTPSESSLMKRVALEPMFLAHLRDTLGIRGVKRIAMHEPLTNLRKVLALVMERSTPSTEIWRALYGAAALHRAAGKYIIAVNDDIDPDNADALFWAMSYRANPSLDLEILSMRRSRRISRRSRSPSANTWSAPSSSGKSSDCPP
jgi:UbiD family decarboxylase